jgi:fimbrial chaperone protein
MTVVAAITRTINFRTPLQRLAVAALAAASLAAHAGDFGVSPIRLDLDRGTRSGVIAVSNDGDTPLNFQARAMLWTQGEAGQDRYEDTQALVYFPRQFQIPPQEKRVVRVGYRNPAQDKEQAYRLFIEELPNPKARSNQTSVTVAVRFGVPIFVRPPTSDVRAQLEALSVKAGRAQVTVRNAGPVHFRITGVRFRALGADGATTWESTVQGWYLLVGTQRTYAAALPAEACRASRALRVEVLGDKLDAASDLALTPELCP